ncbi:MAG: tetratricopeptide (TPR) repeat protein/glycosyltransferase involved in cell wall biosynthesis, partial [Planctomycetota bacterium]
CSQDLAQEHPDEPLFLMVRVAVLARMNESSVECTTLIRRAREVLLSNSAQWKKVLGEQSADCWIGKFLFDVGCYPAAITAFEAAVVQGSGVESRMFLARSLIKTGDRRAAIEHYKQARELSVGNLALELDLARCLISTGEYDEARMAFERAVELDPNSHDAHYHLGRMRMRAQDSAGAVASFERALELRPKAPATQHEAGRGYMQARRFDEAESALQQALKLDPTRSVSRHELGRVYAMSGRLELARDTFRLTLKEIPGNVATWWELGRVANRLGEGDEAERMFERAVEMRPDHSQSLYELSLVALQKRERDTGAQLLDRAIRYAPDRVPYLLRRARLRFEDGDLRTALEDCRHANEIEPEHERVSQLITILEAFSGTNEATGRVAVIVDPAMSGEGRGRIEAGLEEDSELEILRDVTTSDLSSWHKIADSVEHDWVMWVGAQVPIDESLFADLLGARTSRNGYAMATGDAERMQPGTSILLMRSDLAHPLGAPTVGASAISEEGFGSLCRELQKHVRGPKYVIDKGRRERLRQPLPTPLTSVASEGGRPHALLVSTSGSRLFGGVEHFLRGMAEIYSSLGFEPVIVGMSRGVDEEEVIDGLRCVHLPGGQSHFRSFVLRERPALIHSTTGTGYSILQAVQDLKVGTIYGTHFWRDMFQGDGWFADIDLHGVPNIDFRFLLQRATAVYSNSMFTRDITERHFGAYTPVVYSLPPDSKAVEETGSAIEGVPQDHALLVNSRVEKGFDLLLELASALPQIPFVAIASQSPIEEARAAIEARGLANVTLLEQVDDMAPLYRSARVVLVPSYSFVESFSRVVIEAHRHAVPVIGSDRGNVPVLLREAGVSLPREVNAWRTELKRLWSDSGYREERRIQARANSDRYAFSQQFKRIGRLVESVRQRVLVAVGSGIGNILQVTPAIRKLSEHLGHPVDVVISQDFPGCGTLLAGSPYVGMVMPLGPDIVQREYDFVFVTDSFGENIPPLLSDQIFVTRRQFPFSLCMTMHEAHFNLRCLAGAGLGIELEAEDYRRTFIGAYDYSRPDGQRIGLHAGGKAGVWSNKRWPYFDRLIADLESRGFEVVSFGGPDEFVEGTINLTGTPLDETIRNMMSCDYFVANDSGLMHIADVLTIPLTTIFGPTSVIKNGPLSGTSRVVELKKDCAPCQFDARFQTCSCIADVTLEEVRDSVLTHWDEMNLGPASTPTLES